MKEETSEEKKQPKRARAAITAESISGKRNLNEREVERIYGIGIRQLRHMRMSGDGPRYVKISGTIGSKGGRVLYQTDALEEWFSTLPCGGGRAAHA